MIRTLYREITSFYKKIIDQLQVITQRRKRGESPRVGIFASLILQAGAAIPLRVAPDII